MILRKEDTLALKGVALLFLLSHHLFYLNDGVYDDILLGMGHYLVQEIGIMSKICVAFFVFLSGYGLMVQTERKHIYLEYAKKLVETNAAYSCFCDKERLDS